MKQYEIMTIYKLELGEQGAKDLSSKVQEAITANDGEIKAANFWGKRKFAYEIKHATEGFYDVINFNLEPSKLKKFEGKLKVMTGIVRYLVTA